MTGGQIMCDVEGPEYGEHVLAFVLLDATVQSYLLDLRKAWKKLEARVGTALFSFEIHEGTVGVVSVRYRDDFDQQIDQTAMKCACDTWAALWPVHELDGPTEKREDPRVDAKTVVVYEQGVKWTWYAKHGGSDAYATKMLEWVDIEDLTWCSEPSGVE